MKLAWLMLGLALAALAGCKRPGPPSFEYGEARDKLIEIRKDRGVDAYFDPRIEDVLALLSQVDPKSIDAPAAKQLAAEIDNARAEKAKHDSDQAKLIEQARATPTVPLSSPGVATATTLAPKVQDGGPVDAGPPKDPVAGMTDSDFRNLFSDCYQYVRPSLSPTGAPGETWGLKDIATCRDRHPGSVDHVVILRDGKVIGIVPAQEAAPKEFKLVDGRLVPVTTETPKPPPAPTSPPQPAKNELDTTPAPEPPAPPPPRNELDTTPGAPAPPP
jgi:hypothetical protein